MSDGRAWQGNVKVRLYERVREHGYDFLTVFAEARPAVPLSYYAATIAAGYGELLLPQHLSLLDLFGSQLNSEVLCESGRQFHEVLQL